MQKCDYLKYAFERFHKEFPNAKTHCANGHEYTFENSWFPMQRNGYQFRQCLTCRKARKHKGRLKQIEQGKRTSDGVYIKHSERVCLW